MVDAAGEHGSIMSIDMFRGVSDPWCVKKAYANDLIMNSDIDGMKNTQEVFDYIKSKSLPMSTFPAFEWCQKLGDGWYIPSIGQLEMFINYWLGNEIALDWDMDDDSDHQLDENSASHPKMVNRILLDAGGYPFLSGLYTSTKSDNGEVYTYYYNNVKHFWKFYKRGAVGLGKYTSGRAFYDF